jgi:glycosyltransferase involved in cell wall biosynthesis
MNSSTYQAPPATISVIIIAKNLAWNIARIIESVMRETPVGTQIIVVDSASKDETVSIARSYGVNVIQLNAQQRLTAAAGRFVGHQHANGKYVLFLDGDMALQPGWLPLGIAALNNDGKLAAVCGELVDVDPVPVTKAELAGKPQRTAALSVPVGTAMAAVREIDYCGGAALYRGHILKMVGGFNPALYSDEEPELCLRIRQAGFAFGKLDVPMVLHYSKPHTTSISADLLRWRKNLYIGYGQNLRNKLGTQHFWPYVKERGHGIPFVGLMVAGLLALVLSVALGMWLIFAAWLVLQAVIIAAFAAKKRSLYLGLAGYIHRILCADGTVRGFFLDSLAHLRNYTPNFKIVD